jgi:putative hemolysin
MNDAWEVIVFSLGILFSGFYSGSEAALLSIPIDRARQLIEEGGARAKALSFYEKRQGEFLTTILVGNNLVNTFVAALATSIASRYFAENAISIAVGLVTFLILIFGEIIPKTFARSQAENLATPMIRILQLNYYVLYPIVQSISFVIRIVLGNNAQWTGRMITKDDIEFMVNKAEKEKSIDSKQIHLLNSILEFPSIKVKDIMVSRTQVNAFRSDFSYDESMDFIRDWQHSRYPVFGEDSDEVIGFIHVKDLFLLSDSQKADFNLNDYVKDAFFVYEHMKIQSVFDHMNRNKVHMAMVKDENGLMVGIITLEDIMEEIFGEIQDEHDEEDDSLPSIEGKVDESGILVPANISIRDLNSEYDIRIPQSDNYSTLAGFILDKLGNHFPQPGQMIFWDHYTFEICKLKSDHIEEVKISFVDPEKYQRDRVEEDAEAI